MDTDIENLFGQLKTVIKKQDTSNSDTSKPDETLTWEQNDMLTVEDGHENKIQEQFQDIEKNLKKLPKLQNDFDNMVQKDQKKTTPLKLDSKVTKQKKTDINEDWFTLPKPDGEMLAKAQRDLILIKHRSALDPKRHYKKDRWQVPERFAVGTIIEDKTEFFSSRLTNKERRSTILETLMSDKDTTGYFKRKYNEIQTKKTSGKKAHYKKMKSMRHR